MQHLIAEPASNQIDDSDVNTGAEDLHSACSAKESCIDILGFKSQVWDVEFDGGIEGLRDHFWGDIFPPPIWRHDTR